MYTHNRLKTHNAKYYSLQYPIKYIDLFDVYSWGRGFEG